MWTSADGHTLRLSDTGLGSARTILHHADLQDLIRQHYRGSLREALTAAFDEVVRRARRQRTLREPPSGRRDAVFTTAVNRRTYLIITRPRRDGQFVIVSILPRARTSAPATLGPGRDTTW